MTDHTWGVDKSHFDAPTGTGTLVNQGFGFLTHKAGGDAPDAELNAWWNDAKPHRADILLGAYWVLYPGHGAGAGDSFLARLDSQCPGWRDGPFILQLDCEEWNSDAGTMPHLADIRSCANRLRTLAPKLMPIVYAPKWAYGNTLNGLGFPLWSSSYTSAQGAASAIYPGDGYSGWSAYSGIVPAIAQFSSTATAAGDTTSDVNCFKGTQQQLAALLAPGFTGGTVARQISDDDVDAIVDALVARTAQSDSTPYNRMAESNWDQGIPDGTDPAGKRQTAWKVVENLGVALRALQGDVTYLRANPASVDVSALATALGPVLAPLIDHDSPAELATAIETAIHQIVAPSAVGNQVPSFDLPAAAGLPIFDDVDAATKAARLARQPEIQGSGE